MVLLKKVKRISYLSYNYCYCYWNVNGSITFGINVEETLLNKYTHYYTYMTLEAKWNVVCIMSKYIFKTKK